MKTFKSKLLTVALAALPAVASMAVGQGPGDNDQPQLGGFAMEGDSIIPQQMMVYKIVNDSDNRPIYPTYMLGRAYDDGIVIRWVNSHFVPWKLSSAFGYTIVRTDITGDEWIEDTISTNFLPLSLQGFMDRFGQQDSIAGMAAQLLYGEGAERLNGEGPSGNAFVDVYDEQQSRFGDAMMVAEWRPDLGEAMGIRYKDTNVKPGHTYRYVVYSNVPDSVMRITPGSLRIKDIPYDPPTFKPLVFDSLTNNGHAVMLMWQNSTAHSAYDIERMREPGDGSKYNPTSEDDGKWILLNKNPFITMVDVDMTLPEWNSYTDTRDIMYGKYQYRVRGYDAFGDKTNWTKPHTVEVKDIEPPTVPRILYFEINRDSLDRPISADIAWAKDSIEDDMAGYNIYYYHEKQGNEWRKLNDEMLGVNDTMYTAPIVGLPSGFVIVAAVDEAGNSGASMPFELFIDDLEPPTPPTGLKHLAMPDGRILIGWKKNPEEDIRGYQLYWANQLDHPFLQLGEITRDTVYVDSTAVVGINQRYVYYALQAVDYAGNFSQMSEPMRVTRIHYGDVYECIPDSTWQTEETLYSRWSSINGENAKEYRVYRTVKGDDNWQMIRIIDAEDVVDNQFVVEDSPLPNREKQYFYAVETVGPIGQTAGLDHTVAFWHRGKMVIDDIDIKLTCQVNDIGRVLLHWDTYGNVPVGNHWYVVFMKRPGDEYFSELRSFAIDQQDFNYTGASTGEPYEFRVAMRWEDGRRSVPSNTVTTIVTLPKEQTEDEIAE